MNYTEYHELIQKEDMLDEYINKNIPFRNIHLNKREEIVLTSNETTYVASGTIGQLHPIKENFIFNLSTSGNFIMLLTSKDYIHSKVYKIMAIEDTHLNIFNTSNFLDFLDSNQFLSDFLYEQLKKETAILEANINLAVRSSRDKVLFTLQLIAAKCGVINTENSNWVVLPKWVRIKLLAKMSNSSISMTSQSVKQLAAEGLLSNSTLESNWRLNVGK
ncbi:hypothetical protein ACSMFR_13205 [Listeria aquatica]|uniref:hypothetical protein n=1 Tax=Listeria aquatica TaxID=1494960 RepID=UPI003F6FBF95